jgi:hypothetical protein
LFRAVALGEVRRRPSSPARLGEKGQADRDRPATPLASDSGERGFAAWRQLARKRQDSGSSPPRGRRRNPHGNDRLGIVRLLSPQCSCKMRVMRFGPHIMCGDAVSTLELLLAAGLAGLLKRARREALSARGASERPCPATRQIPIRRVASSAGNAPGATGPESIRGRFPCWPSPSPTATWHSFSARPLTLEPRPCDKMPQRERRRLRRPRKFNSSEATASSTARRRRRRAFGS